MSTDEVIATLINKLQTLDSDIKTKTKAQNKLISDLDIKKKDLEQLEVKIKALDEKKQNIEQEIQEREANVKKKEDYQLLLDKKAKEILSTDEDEEITLNIGGKLFFTRKSTLTSQENVFYRMFSSGCFKPNKKGEYFFDRNPEYFEIILDYLRGYEIDWDDVKSERKLFFELDYYSIEINKLDVEMKQKMDRMRKQVERKEELKMLKYGNSNFLNSNILDAENCYFLAEMLPDFTKTYKLIHNFSNGTSAQQFDASVKGKGPTLIIMKANTDFIFGAYIIDVWGSSNGWIPGNKGNFIFSFGKNHTPVKLNNLGIGNGIHIKNCGLDMSDLTAFCSFSCTKPTLYILDPYYTATLDDKTIAGSANWTMKDCEVFHEL
jgi:hypothetical protein